MSTVLAVSDMDEEYREDFAHYWNGCLAWVGQELVTINRIYNGAIRVFTASNEYKLVKSVIPVSLPPNLVIVNGDIVKLGKEVSRSRIKGVSSSNVIYQSVSAPIGRLTKPGDDFLHEALLFTPEYGKRLDVYEANVISPNLGVKRVLENFLHVYSYPRGMVGVFDLENKHLQPTTPLSYSSINYFTKKLINVNT